MAEVKVLIEGKHQAIEDKVYISSTVTLIKDDGKNILVDTSHIWNKEKLISALETEGLAPNDIDMVVLTHTHLDHTANTYLFNNAEIFAKFNFGYPGQLHNTQEECIERFDIETGTNLSKDVEFLITTGHSIDSLSIKVNTADGIIVIAGDAIASEEFADLKKQPNSDWIYSLEEYNNSRKKILAIADFVIPGHGEMFKVKK
jgi:glyoxylase-like metal-dependent hydrolase (beta-lactamase superfamily II)